MDIVIPTSDKRGSVVVAKVDDTEIILTELVKGAKRGGHYHDHDQMHILLTGSVRLDIIKAIGNAISKSYSVAYVNEGTGINVSAYDKHMFTALEHSVIVEIKKKGTKTINYPPWRKLVEKTM